MKIKIDNLQLCEDCMSLHETGDATALDYHYGPKDAERRLNEIEEGLKRFGPHLVSNWTSETGEGFNEFSWAQCACCRTYLGGARYRYSVLESESAA